VPIKVRQFMSTLPRTYCFEALGEPLEQLRPDLVLADLILDAVLEIGIVVTSITTMPRSSCLRSTP